MIIWPKCRAALAAVQGSIYASINYESVLCGHYHIALSGNSAANLYVAHGNNSDRFKKCCDVFHLESDVNGFL